ncbi:hypothetical protein [Limosilactobacillus portuensis]|uniref:hypothetical protein n=1 Tax=Limosilactobacillus portuensis TaxID=2742601 RepID=UPI003D7471A5
MAFKEIQPGQADWLKILNDSLKNNKWDRQQLNGTLINGCTGWVAGTIGYDADMYVACIAGWITLPNKSVTEFSTNPFDGILDTKGLAVIGTAFVGQKTGQNNFAPMKFVDDGNLGILGNTGSQWDENVSYTGWISMTFVGPRGQLKI